MSRKEQNPAVPRRAMAFRNWYAGDCRQQLDDFLLDYSPPSESRAALAVAVPHAGWRYSGRVAAHAFKVLAMNAPRTLVLLSAAHRGTRFGKAAVYSQGSWETPLGDVEVDAELAREILARGGDLVVSDPDAHATEHALEVELPMVRALMPQARIVPILAPPEAAPVELGRIVAAAAGERDVAAVASTDLTHYGTDYGFLPAGRGPSAHDWMRANDRRILDLAVELKAEEIVDEARTSYNACGPGALAAAVAFARERGAEGGRVLEHTDSYEVSGEPGTFDMAVGYAGVVFR